MIRRFHTRTPRSAWACLKPLATVATVVVVTSCSGSGGKPSDVIKPSYDKTTGRLTELSFDSNKDGRLDTWTDMDGARPLRSRIDRNGDGKIDRWEEYDASGGLVRVGFSRNDNGRADAWAMPRADNTVERVEISSTGDEHKINRWEYYDPATAAGAGGVLVRAEEDTDGDGKVDKWETYQDGALATVAFDENHDGTADRRLTYRGAAIVTIESHPDASRNFTERIDVKYPATHKDQLQSSR